MKCPKCGGSLPGGAAECRHCGILIQKYIELQKESEAKEEEKKRAKAEAMQHRIAAEQAERAEWEEEKRQQREEFKQENWSRCPLCDSAISRRSTCCMKCGHPICHLRSVFAFHWIWVLNIAVGVVCGGVLAAVLTFMLSILGLAGLFSLGR